MKVSATYFEEEILDNDTYELLIELMGAMDTQFQFWLTVTSAFVAAHYVAGSRLGGVVRGYLSFVYSLHFGFYLFLN